LHIKTWRDPKSVLILLLGYFLWRFTELGFKTGELFIDRQLKATTVAVEYGQIFTGKQSELEGFRRRLGFAAIKRNLDDDIFDSYFVIPIQFHNRTRNPVASVSFILDAGCEAARIIDVEYIVRHPIEKKVTLKHDLPEFQLVVPTDDVVTEMRWDAPPGTRINAYCSIAKDRGFGKVNSMPIIGNRSELHFAPNSYPSHWYLRLAATDGAIDADVSEVTVVPNALFRDLKLKSVHDEANIEPRRPTWDEREKMPFLRGRTRITFDSGLDAGSQIDVYLIGKLIEGESLRPSVKMDGAPGTSFKEENLAPRIDIPETKPLDAAKLNLTPERVFAVSDSKSVVVLWDLPNCPNYAGAKIYRTVEKRIGDYSSVGEKIFEGYGNQGPYSFLQTSDHTLTYPPYPTPFSSDLLAQFFHNSPPPPPPPVKSRPDLAPENVPQPPTGFSIGIVQNVPHRFYILDSPPDKDANYSYTIYCLDQDGKESYPVTTNVRFDSASNGLRFDVTKQPPSTSR